MSEDDEFELASLLLRQYVEARRVGPSMVKDVLHKFAENYHLIRLIPGREQRELLDHLVEDDFKPSLTSWANRYYATPYRYSGGNNGVPRRQNLTCPLTGFGVVLMDSGRRKRAEHDPSQTIPGEHFIFIDVSTNKSDSFPVAENEDVLWSVGEQDRIIRLRNNFIEYNTFYLGRRGYVRFDSVVEALLEALDITRWLFCEGVRKSLVPE